MIGYLGSTRKLIRLAVLAGAIIAATIGLGQEAGPISASHTEIVFSYSSTEPIPASVVVAPGGAQAIYVWAVGVDEPTGVSGFQVEITFDGDVVRIASFQPETAWLGSTGRPPNCSPPPVITENFASLACNTYLAPGAYLPGPHCPDQCDGLLASIALNPQITSGPASLLSLAGQASTNGTFLLTTPPDLDVGHVDPVALRNANLYVKCGDVAGPGGELDGVIDLFNDIVAEIDAYQLRDPEVFPPGSPDWDPIYDMDGNGIIDLFNDIVAVIAQYGVHCTQPQP